MNTFPLNLTKVEKGIFILSQGGSIEQVIIALGCGERYARSCIEELIKAQDEWMENNKIEFVLAAQMEQGWEFPTPLMRALVKVMPGGKFYSKTAYAAMVTAFKEAGFDYHKSLSAKKLTLIN